ncbi:Sideroflexin-2 [Blattella germanica]|nr:Sideroflexin-2 [Blattella germanica]
MADLGPKGSLYIGSGQNRLTVNIDKPRWDQSTYFGRMKHFFAITDTRNAFVSSKKLAESKALIQKYKNPPAVIFWQWFNQSFNAITMPPIVGRFVPFIAIVAANLINIPIMRNRELIEGVDVMDDNNNTLGRSKRAARRGISYVVFSRIMMASIMKMKNPPNYVFYNKETSPPNIRTAHPICWSSSRNLTLCTIFKCKSC